MRLLASFFSLLPLFALRPSVASSLEPGVCSVTNVVEKRRLKMDREVGVWKHEKYNHTVELKECCEGYQVKMQRPLSCIPVCGPPCENSDCMAPDTCVCHPGHVMINNSTNSCNEVCDSCINGKCISAADTECSCYPGYTRNPRFPHICDPICSPPCVHAECTAPMLCECHHGYKPYEDHGNICLPHCEKGCVFGECIGPNECSCNENYVNDKDSPSICLPMCNMTCENGYCFAPDSCKCHVGFEKHQDNPYQCIPLALEGSPLKQCSLSLLKAVKYDKDSNCFIIKEKIALSSVTPNCRTLESNPKSICSKLSHCHQDECALNFWCTAKISRGSVEIYCNLEPVEIEVDLTVTDRTINTTEWTDAVLVVVNSYTHLISPSEIRRNVTKEWILHPLTNEPICNKTYFTMKMSECEIGTSLSQLDNHINSSLLFWISVFLICGFLLLVGAGVGGFLWARHRKLNNPLNYREDMVEGRHNECYSNQRVELVSDDDSDHYCDDPL